MSVLDVILFVILALFVIYLAIVAATEPRYTWRDIATPAEKFAEAWRELNESIDRLKKAVGDKLVPVFIKLVEDTERAFSEAGRNNGH